MDNDNAFTIWKATLSNELQNGGLQYLKALFICMEKFNTTNYLDVFTHPDDVMKVVTLTSKRKTIEGYFKAIKSLLNKLPSDIHINIDKKAIDYINTYKNYLPSDIENQQNISTSAPDDKSFFCGNGIDGNQGHDDSHDDSIKYVLDRLDIIEKRFADFIDNTKDSFEQQRKIILRQQKLIELLLGTLHPQMANVLDIYNNT